MTPARRCAALGLVVLAAALAGCGSSATPGIAPAYRIERTAGSPASTIVLTATGASRIGIETARAGKAGSTVTIPYAAVVYDPNGKTFAFLNPAPLTYAEVPIAIESINGNSAYLLKGPRPGTRVVTVGAEELLGVQTGVLAQT